MFIGTTLSARRNSITHVCFVWPFMSDAVLLNCSFSHYAYQNQISTNSTGIHPGSIQYVIILSVCDIPIYVVHRDNKICGITFGVTRAYLLCRAQFNFYLLLNNSTNSERNIYFNVVFLSS